MCSRSLAGSAVMAMLLLSACQREQRESRGQPLAETAPTFVQLPSVLIAGSQPAPADPRGKLYEGNAYHISEGQRHIEYVKDIRYHLFLSIGSSRENLIHCKYDYYFTLNHMTPQLCGVFYYQRLHRL